MTERDREPPIESPPEGSACNEHPERPALAVCPRCGGYVCMACWHHPIRRCHACLMRDPAAASPPVPWERPGSNALARFFGTLGDAFRPIASAPSFARGDAVAPRSFLLLGFLPLALLAAIVPFTRTLLFGPRFAISVVGSADAQAIALDVAIAAGIGLLICAAQVVALALPYVSLARAYASKGHVHAPVRAILYRAWLIPLGEVLRWIVVWSAPDPPPPELLPLAQLLQVIPLVLLFASLRATARMGSGVGPFASVIVTIVPFVAMLLVQGYLATGLAPILPDSAALEAETAPETVSAEATDAPDTRPGETGAAAPNAPE